MRTFLLLCGCAALLAGPSGASTAADSKAGATPLGAYTVTGTATLLASGSIGTATFDITGTITLGSNTAKYTLKPTLGAVAGLPPRYTGTLALPKAVDVTAKRQTADAPFTYCTGKGNYWSTRTKSGSTYTLKLDFMGQETQGFFPGVKWTMTLTGTKK